MTSSFSLSLLLHYLLLPIVMHAAVSDSLEQCRLCRESEETSNCLSRGIKYESELLHIRLEEEQHAFVVSLSIQKFFGDESGKKGHCFFTLRRPKDGSTINVTTAGVSDAKSCWYAKKSRSFKVVQQIFLNYDGSCDPGQDLLGHYSLGFGLGDAAGFFVAAEEESVDPAKADASERDCFSGNNETCRYEVTREHLSFRRCRKEAGSRVKAQTCDGNRTGGNSSANFVRSNSTSSSLLLDLSPRCDASFTLSCFVPNVTKEAARLVATVVSVFNGTSSSSSSVSHVSAASSSWGALLAGMLTGAAVALACLIRRRYAKYSVAQREEESPSNQSTLDGPRIRLPDPTPKQQHQQQHQHQQGGIRPRLASVLSATLSMFTSSSSSGGSSSSSRSSSGCHHPEAMEEEPAEEELQMMPLGYQPWMRDKLFSMQSLEIRSELGRGHYGVVYSAHVVDGTARWPVAVKCAKGKGEEEEDAGDDDDANVDLSPQEELIKEGEVMAALPYHENIANLQGVALDSLGPEPPRFFLMIEYCGVGSLHRYLLANRVSLAGQLRRCRFSFDAGGVTCGVNLLVGWAHQIARGMKYLSSRSILHGDLATRNVLLTDDLTAKIADFGLSYRLGRRETSAELRQTHLPERWMAPESIITGRVTKECDVWSFGILVWELFSLGELPYKDLLVDSSAAFLDALRSGVRPTVPESCPAEVSAEVMAPCWSVDPADRPDFRELAARLAAFLDPGYTHRYQEAREEMLRRYSRIQQNRMYFSSNSDDGGADADADADAGAGANTGGDGYCVMAAPTGTTADTVVTVDSVAGPAAAAAAAATAAVAAPTDGYCFMEGVS